MSRRADKPTHCPTLTITVSSYHQKPVSSFTCWGFFCYHLTSYSWSPFYRKETIPPVLSPHLSFWTILAFSTICIVQGWVSINLPIFNCVSTRDLPVLLLQFCVLWWRAHFTSHPPLQWVTDAWTSPPPLLPAVLHFSPLTVTPSVSIYHHFPTCLTSVTKSFFFVANWEFHYQCQTY